MPAVGSNQQVLTRGDRKLANKRAGRVDSVVYDPKSREDYLTGFHKRKVKRKEDAKKRAEEFAHKQHLEERRKLRQERTKSVNMGMERLQEAEAIIEGHLAGRGDAGDEHNSGEDEEEFTGFSDSSGILKPRRTAQFEGEEGRSSAQVTIEPLELDPYVDMSKAEDVLNESTRKANEYAKFVQGLETARQPQKQPKQPKAKPRKKKFRYKQPMS